MSIKRVIGADTWCMRCGDKATHISLLAFLCERCAEKEDARYRQKKRKPASPEPTPEDTDA